MAARPSARSVFINCPFDKAYKDLFAALVFAVHDCGFYVRCALETEDSGEIRYKKICQLIRECRYGIHDISRTALDPDTGLPHFNMPLELGLFLGAKEFGLGRGARKVCLVLDTEEYRYRKFCSDLAGSDISVHNNKPLYLVLRVRDWLQVQLRNQPSRSRELVPNGHTIFQRFRHFLKDLPILCQKHRLDHRNLKFGEYVTLLEGWLLAQADWRHRYL